MPPVQKRVRTLDRDLERLSFQIGTIFDDIQLQIERELSQGPKPITRVLEVVNSTDRIIAQSGLDNVINSISETYGRTVGEVSQTYTEAGVKITFSNRDDQLLSNIIRLDLNSLRSVVNDWASRVKSEILRQTLSGRRIEFARIFEAQKQIALNEINKRTLNAVQGVYNGLVVGKAVENKVKSFLYEGPLDEKTRPFCRERVGRVFTLKEIQAMDNEQGLPVITNLGGYNCRHQFKPVN